MGKRIKRDLVEDCFWFWILSLLPVEKLLLNDAAIQFTKNYGTSYKTYILEFSDFYYNYYIGYYIVYTMRKETFSRSEYYIAQVSDWIQRPGWIDIQLIHVWRAGLMKFLRFPLLSSDVDCTMLNIKLKRNAGIQLKRCQVIFTDYDEQWEKVGVIFCCEGWMLRLWYRNIKCS